MKKLAAMILTAVMLFAACGAYAGETGLPQFASIGEVMDAESDKVMAGYGEAYAVAFEQNGKYYRAVAHLDEEADRLNDAIGEADPDGIEAAFEAYYGYIRTLPVVYVEEFTVLPKEQAELDTLAGKTYRELEEAGYDYMSSGSDGDENRIVFVMAYGVYQYDFVMDTDYEGYSQAEESGSYDDLKVVAAAFSGLSANAAELRFHADGVVEEPEDLFAEFNKLSQMVSDAVAEAAAGGETDKEALIDELIRLSPEHEEEIRMLVEIILMMGTGEADGLPAYVYTGEDPVEGAIANMLANDERATQYLTEPGYVTIPCPIIHKTEMTDDTHAKVYGSFWILNYARRGTCLENISGGEYPGIILLEKTDGEWQVTAMEEAGDGDDYAEDIRRFADGDEELEEKYFSAADLGAPEQQEIRTRFIRDYAEANHLDVTAYQDYGWDPVPLQ